MATTERRFPIWEVTPFEKEHDYALHSSLQFKDQKKEQICINKTVLLENPVATTDDNIDDDDVDIDVEVLESPGKPAYNHQKVKSMSQKFTRGERKIIFQYNSKKLKSMRKKSALEMKSESLLNPQKRMKLN